MYDIQPPRPARRRSFWALVHRRPGLLAALVTLLVGAGAVTVGLVAPAPVPADVPVVERVGEEVRDDALGLIYTLPERWTRLEGDEFLFNVSSGATREPRGNLLLVGLVDDSLFAAAEPTVPDVARRLASDFGEFAIPVPGTRADRIDRATTVDGRSAWESGYRVMPRAASDDGGDVNVTVVQDGDRLVYATIIVSPADPDLLDQARTAVSSIRFS